MDCWLPLTSLYISSCCCCDFGFSSFWRRASSLWTPPLSLSRHDKGPTWAKAKSPWNSFRWTAEKIFKALDDRQKLCLVCPGFRFNFNFFFCRDLMWQRKLPSPAPNPLFGDSQWKTCETMHKNYFSIDISHTNGIPDKECLRAINQKRFMQDYHFFDCFLSSKWRQIGV